ncbi:hypothetical protein D3C87_1300560 [compost metagenome]
MRRFVEPVGDQAGRHHHHARPVETAGVFLAQHVRQCLQGFAQAHVVRENSTHFQLPQRLHPAQAFELIRTQRRIQAVWGGGRVVLDVTQALGKGADLFATLPEQRHVFQRVQARGIGLAQAQRGVAGFLQVELTEGGQHRFQAAEGQGDLQRAVLGIRAIGDVDQDQLVVAASGQAFRVEDFGVGAHQVEQDRQQAQAFAVDDDPQFQVEPVALRCLFDRGVPVVYRGQVETEVLVDLQFPALGAQLRQFIEGKGQPGAVIDHLEQLAGTFRQGLALPGGDFEAEDSQLLAVGLFHFRVAFYPQRLGFLAYQDVGVFLPANVLIQITEGQCRSMLDVALHPAVARFECAEFDAGQPQARDGLHIVHQHLRRGFRAAVFQDCLEFFQEFGVFGGSGVVEGFLHLQEHRCTMFAVVVDRARTRGVDHQQRAFG